MIIGGAGGAGYRGVNVVLALIRGRLATPGPTGLKAVGRLSDLQF